MFPDVQPGSKYKYHLVHVCKCLIRIRAFHYITYGSAGTIIYSRVYIFIIIIILFFLKMMSLQIC